MVKFHREKLREKNEFTSNIFHNNYNVLSSNDAASTSSNESPFEYANVSFDKSMYELPTLFGWII